MTEDLVQLEHELRQLSKEIALLKSQYNRLNNGPEKEKLRRKFKDKQWQATFYMEKIINLADQQKQTSKEEEKP